MPEAKRRGFSPLAIILTLSAGFFFLFLVVSGALFMWKSSDGWESESGSSGALFSAGKGAVGVVELNGVIMDSKKILKYLKDFKEDSSVKAVVMRLNSPGGSVAPSQEIYEAVRQLGKPVVASMSSVAASGAYYIACGAKKIYANPGTITGSIGVIMEFANLKKLYEWAKIERYAITTGKYKNAGAEYKDMTLEEKDLLKGMIDDVLGQFKKAVAEGRKMKLEEVTRVADGRIFSGAQAKAAGLVDQLGTLDDAIKDAAKMAKLEGEPRIVYPRKNRRTILDVVADYPPPDDEESRSSIGGPNALVTALRHWVTGAPLGAASGGWLPSPGVYWLWRDGV